MPLKPAFRVPFELVISTRRSFLVSDFFRRVELRLAGVTRRFISLSTVILALVGLQTLKMWDWFRRVDFASGQPLVNVDYVEFYGRALRAHHFLSTAGRFWGYDPFDMAGYVSGPFLEVGVHFMSLLAHALSSAIPIGVTLLIYEVATLSLAPFLVIPTVRNVGGTREQAWAAFAVIVLVFGFLDPFSEGLYRVGLHGFMVAGFVSLLQVSLAWRWFAGGSWRVGAGLCAVTAVLFQVHPASLVIILIPDLVLFAALVSRLDAKRLVATFAFVGIALLANFYWIHPFVAFSHWKADAPYFVTGGLRDVLAIFNPWRPNLFFGVRVTMLLYIFGLATTMVITLWRRHRPLGATALLWLASLFIAGFFGSDLPVLRTLQPGRNTFAFWMVASVLAGMAVPGVLLRHRGRRAFTVMVYLTCALLMFMPLHRVGRAYPPLTNQLSEGQTRFIAALASHRTEGRALVECVDYGTPHIADLLPFRVPGQLFLGGQHPGNFLKGRFSLFSGAYVGSDGWVSDVPLAFNRPLNSMSETELEDYFRLYNVTLVAARSRSMRAALTRFPHLIGAPEPAGDYAIYPVLKTFGWFDEGSGRVTFAYDRITIDEASPGRLVLRAHWIKTLRVDPPAVLSPVARADDPVPFIAIDNSAGLRRLVVYNAGL